MGGRSCHQVMLQKQFLNVGFVLSIYVSGKLLNKTVGPQHKGGNSPSRQSETQSNDGEHAESGLDHKTKLNSDRNHGRCPS